MPLLHWFIVITLATIILLAAFTLLKEYIHDLLSWLMMCLLGLIIGLVLRSMQREKEKTENAQVSQMEVERRL